MSNFFFLNGTRVIICVYIQESTYVRTRLMLPVRTPFLNRIQLLPGNNQTNKNRIYMKGSNYMITVYVICIYISDGYTRDVYPLYVYIPLTVTVHLQVRSRIVYIC